MATSWRRCFSSKSNSHYWFNERTNESRWDEPPEIVGAPVAPINSTPSEIIIGQKRHDIGDSWIKVYSEKRQKYYWYNEATEESRWEPPDILTNENQRRSPEAEPVRSEAPPAAFDGLEALGSCPPHLLWKRDYLFNGLNQDQLDKLQMDEVAAFSITESKSAEEITSLLWAALNRARGRAKPSASGSTCILDGMACVGGNTISFASAFDRVLCNELDPRRYAMLQHNTLNVMNLRNVTVFNMSVLELAFENNDYDVLFLDPEWGGPEYKNKVNLVLPISDQPMEEFCLSVFQRMLKVSVIGLKLPLNYDNDYVKKFAADNSLLYSFHTQNLKKMSLTILSRK